MSEQDVTALVSEIDRTRRRLYALLRATEARVLSKRPPSGKWSIVENVRHLVFAEQVHLGKFMPDGSAWSPMSLRGKGKEFPVKGGVVVLRYRERQLLSESVGAEPKDDLEEVLRAWDLVHRPIRKAVKETGAEAQYELGRHIAHLLRHVEIIEKQLARASKGKPPTDD